MSDSQLPRTGWTMRQLVAEFVKDIEAAHNRGAPDLADEWPDLHATYEVAVLTLAQTVNDPREPWTPPDPKVERAFRYATDLMTEDDAALIRMDCQRIGGFYPLAGFTRGTVIEQFIERWGDFPMLASLAEIACQNTAQALEGTGADSQDAIDRAFTELEKLTKREGFDLVENAP